MKAVIMLGKKVSESNTIMTEVVFPNDVNNHGTLFGGRLLNWIDNIGGIVAKRHARKTVVTASIDSLNFLHPIQQRFIVTLKAWINYVGRTSMEVEVRVTSENPDTGEITKNCRAFITYVAIGRNGRPVKVPPLIVETPEEITRMKMAKKRRQERLRNLKLKAVEW